jgi:hypothetical protein
MTAVANADIAPPRSVVNVLYNQQPINGTFYAVVLSCTNSSSFNTYGIPVNQLNVSQYDANMGCYWRYDYSLTRGSMWCAGSVCSSEYPQRLFKIAFYLPDLNKTFITDMANNSDWGTKFVAELYPNGSATLTSLNGNNNNTVTDWSGIGLFFGALAVTIIIELAVAFAYLKVAKAKQKGRILVFVVIGNIISLPLVWFGFVLVLGIAGLLIGEVFAVVFEGCFIYYFNKKAMKLKSALLMSLLMNLASAIIGGLILLLLLV